MTQVIEAAPGNGIERSPSDVLRLIVAFFVLLGLMLLDWLAGNTLVKFVHDLLSGLGAMPTWILDAFVIGTRIAAIALDRPRRRHARPRRWNTPHRHGRPRDRDRVGTVRDPRGR